MKRLLVSAFIVLATLGVGGASPAAAAGPDCGSGVDAGNDFTTAMSIGLPTSCAGSTLGVNDIDWYRFSVSTGQTIDIAATGETLAPMDACLYSPLGVLIACGDGVSTKTIDYTATSAGSYRLRIAQGLLGGSYTFDAYISTDCSSGRDAGNTAGTALSVSNNAWCDGHLGGTDTADWYQFGLSAGQMLGVDLYPPFDADFDVCLYGPSSSTVPVTCSVGGVGATESFTHTASVSGTWKVRVFVYAGSGHYGLALST
ncbi:MAG TPA: PPC domain-containing protein [Acidimicrobiales bacterium]